MRSDRMRCHACGKFFSAADGFAWKMLYEGIPRTPDREIYRCKPCLDKVGQFKPSSYIKPEHSVGIVLATNAAISGQGG